MDQLKKIIEDFQSGKCSLEDSVKALAEHVYKYRLWYGLGKLSMDNLHDFMVSYIPRMGKILKGYRKGEGSFEGYLYANISMGLRLWKRKSAASLARENCLNFISRMGIEEKEYAYQMDELSYVCGSQESEAPDVEKLREIKKKFRPVTYNNFRHKSYSGMDYTLFSGKTAKIIKRTCLVLFAKCAYYTDDSLTEKISVITETPVEELQRLRQKVLEELDPKIRRIKKCRSIRNSSFYFRNKYIMEMGNLEDGCYLSREIEKKIAERSRMWDEKNRKLKEESHFMIPTNTAVARVLGISASNVKYILEYAKKNMDNLNFKRYNKCYEDLFGKWQREQKAGNE
ncbi:MAG: hypothetical protein IKN90_01370 [Treponema sp.]|nr:hypothetical protein [Treponema sp.]